MTVFYAYAVKSYIVVIRKTMGTVIRGKNVNILVSNGTERARKNAIT